MEIKFEHVDFSYQKVNCSCKEVFNDLNLSFSDGRVYGIVGQNGSGKTTLLELMYSLILPTNGKIKMSNLVVSDKKNVNKVHSKIGFVYQQVSEQLFNNNVYEELLFSLIDHEYHTDNIEKRISDALKMVGLDDSYRNRNISTLSSGEKRKVAIACSIIYNPKVLLLDEPTAGLDFSDKEDLIKLIRLLKNRYDKTIIIASNDIDFLHRIVDNVFVLYNKKVVLSGDKYFVFTKVDELKQYGVKAPSVIEFSNKVLEYKKIKMGYRDDINDLIKDIYRFVK